MSVNSEFLSAAVRTATPLLLAATGELVIERAGIIYVGIEGSILAGALAAAAGGMFSGTAAAVLLAIGAGALTAALFALFVVRWRTEQIVTGTAITLVATGATAALYHVLFGAEGAGLRVPVIHSIAVPVLSKLPLIGEVLFDQSLFTYAAVAALVVVWWGLARTQLGLAIRACGDVRRGDVGGAGVHRDRDRRARAVAGRGRPRCRAGLRSRQRAAVSLPGAGLDAALPDLSRAAVRRDAGRPGDDTRARRGPGRAWPGRRRLMPNGGARWRSRWRR
jgi:ABC-type uncharacterized transport system permease subunit